MIKSLHIKNFQSHKDTNSEFCPGINAICGQSDRGKSSIIRAIRLIVENRPSGDSYRSNFADGEDTIVKLTTVEKTSVERHKGDKENSYILSTLDKPIRAMGQSVPEEVSQLLDIGSINLQYQMDQPFLISGNSSKLAQYINQMANLEVIDTATSNIRKKILGNNGRKVSLESDIETKTEQISKYDNLDEIDGRLMSAEALEKNIQSTRNTIRDLKALVHLIETDKFKIEELSRVVEKAEPLVEQVKKLVDDSNEISAKYLSLDHLLFQINKSGIVIDEYKNLSKAEPIILDVETKIQEFSKADQKAMNLEELLGSINCNSTLIKQRKQRLEISDKELRAAIPDSCPVCGADKKYMKI